MTSASFAGVMARKDSIMRQSLGIDYTRFESAGASFDYSSLMNSAPTLDEIRSIQHAAGVGNTPLLELPNITSLARKVSPEGRGARILLKDEQCNPSGSFKDRRASISVHVAKELGYKGVIAATSGNYGAAVASQAARAGLRCIIVQECFDSHWVGQPEILEKQRKCEALGAEVVQTTVGPELFYLFLLLLEETGYFNASLYSPYGIAGIEPLGIEITEQCIDLTGDAPACVVATHAGGGNVTGTARGLQKAGASQTQVVGASVDLRGLHMASDSDFNRKSFTTGHTGFGVPYATDPDHSDVPRSAARPLRYMDSYQLVRQGEVFYMTELLPQLDGLERGPAGNTSLAAAFALACTMPADQTVVVQESEYTGAGKHPLAQLSFARDQGIKVSRGTPEEEEAGKTIIIPDSPYQVRVREADLDNLRRSYIRKSVTKSGLQGSELQPRDINYLAEETNTSKSFVTDVLATASF